MAKIRTHYDNLQIARNASDEVIRAAYRTLSQKYHPDKNTNNQNTAERWMKIINEAYAVLSDPDKRRIHDAWIAKKEFIEQPETPAPLKHESTIQQPIENQSNPDEAKWLLYSKASWVALIGTLLSLLEPPYSYYAFLHFSFFIVSVFGVYLVGKERHIAAFFLILVALAFNPIASFVIGTDPNSWPTWFLLNIISLLPIFYVRHELLAMASDIRSDAWLERDFLMNEPSTNSSEFIMTLSYRSLLTSMLIMALIGTAVSWKFVKSHLDDTAEIIALGSIGGMLVVSLAFSYVWLYRLFTKKTDENYSNVRKILSEKLSGSIIWFSIIAVFGYSEYILPKIMANNTVAPQAVVPAANVTPAPVPQNTPVDAVTQNNLGNQYYNGQGVVQDYAQAVYWYRKSADQGYAVAQFNLGAMYDLAQDYAQAVYWYRKSADQGYAVAQLNLGTMYDYGQGIAQDYAQAIYWYRKSADQGYAVAQFNLGAMYDNGHGSVQDHTQAVYWYRKAADQGYANAQGNLGLMYADGLGVSKKDYTQSVYWLRKAADQGNISAQNALSTLANDH
jgi:TPR repeat protein